MFPPINSLVSFILLGVIHYPIWEILGVRLLSVGLWSRLLFSPGWIPCWIIFFFRDILCNSNQVQYWFILVLFGVPHYRCNKVVLFIYFRGPYMFCYELLVFLPSYHTGIHIVPKYWAWGWGVEVEFLTYNFGLSFTNNVYLIRSFQNMDFLGDLLLDLRYIQGLNIGI